MLVVFRRFLGASVQPFWVVFGLTILSYYTPAQARDPSVVREFRKTHPCPATGRISGACPGWQVDHRIPLCFDESGDVVENLQWLSVEDHKAKTRYDIKACVIRREMKRAK